VTDSPTATRTCSIRTITSSDASCNVAQHISLEMMCARANAVTLHPMVRLPVQTTSAHVSELDNPCSLGKSIVTTPWPSCCRRELAAPVTSATPAALRQHKRRRCAMAGPLPLRRAKTAIGVPDSDLD
jgi:hypothetical protein